MEREDYILKKRKKKIGGDFSGATLGSDEEGILIEKDRFIGGEAVPGAGGGGEQGHWGHSWGLLDLTDDGGDEGRTWRGGPQENSKRD